MARLTSLEMKQLREALNDRFDSEEGLNELARELGYANMDNIATGPSVPDILNEVIGKARTNDWLIDLIKTSQRLGVTQTILGQLLDRLQPVEALGDADPCKVHVLRDGSPFVDREYLRTAVSRLDSGARILVVDGERYSGRSYSLRLITYVRDQKDEDSFSIVWQDLVALAKQTVGPIPPEKIGQAIADKMGLGEIQQRQNEQDPAWVQYFCNWLEGKLEGSKIVRWIVIDSFDKVLLSRGAQDLIKELAIRITVSLSMLRLVLLGYPDVMELKGIVYEEPLYERISPISIDEVGKFFITMYDARKRLKDVEFTDNDVTGSLARVKSHVNPEKSDLIALSKAVAQELKTII